MNLVFSILFTFLQFIGRVLFDYWGWLPLMGYLGYMIYQNTKKHKYITQTETVLLEIDIPRDNDKLELSAEQMFASLHGLIKSKNELKQQGGIQGHLSFEIAYINGRVYFYVWTPKRLKQFVESQIYAQYPEVKIRSVKQDYSKTVSSENNKIIATELKLSHADILPIRTYKSLEINPLTSITKVLAQLPDNEQAWIQILTKPIDEKWITKGERYVEKTKAGKRDINKGDGAFGLPIYLFRNFFSALWKPPQDKDNKTIQPQLDKIQNTKLQAINEKISKIGYEVIIRIVHIGQDAESGHLRIQSLVGSFNQFNTSLNRFNAKASYGGEDALRKYRARLFNTKGNIFNIEELASLFHLPHNKSEIPEEAFVGREGSTEPSSKLQKPKSHAPEELSLIGSTNSPENKQQFGISRSDRSKHLYVVGQTGTGKSFLMELLAISDIHYNHGIAIIDPHGDFATDILKFIPKERIDDVVYFNPADNEYPIAFNPLDISEYALSSHVSIELVAVLKRMFKGSTWNQRVEYLLRYAILALLYSPNPTILQINRLLTESEFRQSIVEKIEDSVVKNFWVNEFTKRDERFTKEAIDPILNQLGAFTANPLIRNIIGQPKNKINFRELMDNHKILIVNLPSGQIGEEEASILGSLIVTSIQLAAMSRTETEYSKRKPFYLYIDEFQNFATDSFTVILSEARKYGLYLTLANQYVAQMPETVRSAIFGNISNLISFRVGSDDSKYLEKYFSPKFKEEDLIGLHNRHYVISMSIEGKKQPSFSATSLTLPEHGEDYTNRIIELSRKKYSSEKHEIEQQIKNSINTDTEHSTNTYAMNDRRKQALNITNPDINNQNKHTELKPDEPIKLR